ncbi:uncharacterized protein KY384_000616 [Bacidia gigantensis]|uniref:uncharacterized protein n=1 Tax=Bacidia gigantensis TaxID=2732470 RepID=UPI001D04C1AF|nr:uncharacterized protein KY384_000616 [Bacidia gigantensis]KAG8525856.1 hypothetical protein KY384_000616 [Bacidia gigantensis]
MTSSQPREGPGRLEPPGRAAWDIPYETVDFFGGGRIGFLKLKAEVSNDDGERLPGSVFLRGGSVAMMLILQADDAPSNSETDKHVILTLQARVPSGSLAMTELPAGMLDDAGTFAGGAAKEIAEETGLEISAEELIDMTALAITASAEGTESSEKLQRAMYTSPGGSDEFIPLFLWQKRVPRETLKDWQGKLTGLRQHGEKITLQLCRLEDLWKIGARDSKILGAVTLYEGLRREGRT